MSYHYHITIQCTDQQLKTLAEQLKAKPASIDLWKDKNIQTDRMLTKYHRNYEILKQRAQKDMQDLESSGFVVQRLKVEKVVSCLPKTFTNRYKYFEGHLKVVDNEDLPDVEGFVLSKNTSKQGTKFYNFRVRSQKDLEMVRDNLIKLPQLVESELEEVLYDSNENLDLWWA